MNFDELWIGDEVYLKDRGINARWDGLAADGKARVRIGEQIFLVDILVLDEPRKIKNEERPKKIFSQKKSIKTDSQSSSEIDLHIEVLAPERKHDLPEMILDYQLRRCRQFIDSCIENGRPTALIIHGKGTGVLKAEVLHMLEGTPEVKFSFAKKDGGATEVWFTAPY